MSGNTHPSAMISSTSGRSSTGKHSTTSQTTASTGNLPSTTATTTGTSSIPPSMNEQDDISPTFNADKFYNLFKQRMHIFNTSMINYSQ